MTLGDVAVVKMSCRPYVQARFHTPPREAFCAPPQKKKKTRGEKSAGKKLIEQILAKFVGFSFEVMFWKRFVVMRGLGDELVEGFITMNIVWKNVYFF